MFGNSGMHRYGVYPLDTISQACKGAYSFRRLRKAYTGNCCQVKRSSDSTTQDIGFAGNEMDQKALLAFVGAGNGAVSKWYDQSGNGYDFTNAAAFGSGGEPPYIVLAGVLYTVHSQPALYFDNTIKNQQLSYGTGGNLFTGTAWSAITYAKAEIGSSGNGGAKYGARCVFEDSSQDIWQTFYDSGAGTLQYVSGNQNDSNEVTITLGAYPAEGILTSRYPTTGTTFGASVNGGAETTHASSNTSIGSTIKIGLGGSGGALSRFQGYIGECVFFNVAITKAQMDALGVALAPRWAQTWAALT